MKKLICKIFGHKTVYVIDHESIVKIPHRDFDFYSKCTTYALVCERCKRIHFIEFEIGGEKLAR